MDRSGSGAEYRLRSIEEAFARERQQRDVLEKKYSRLKRRYIRLERSHNRLVMELHTKRSSKERITLLQSETPTRESSVAMIDLTSTQENVDKNASSCLYNSSKGRHFDDICPESPSSSLDSSTREQSQNGEDQEEKERTLQSLQPRSDRVTSNPVRRRRLHLDFSLPSNVIEPNRAVSSPRRQMQQSRHSNRSVNSNNSPHTARSKLRHDEESRARTRPRLRLHNFSSERSAARSYGQEIEQEQEPRANHHDRYHWVSEPSPEPTTPSPLLSSPIQSVDLAPVLPTIRSEASRLRVNSDEEASLALALYLQHQENIAAHEEYEARLSRHPIAQELNHESLFSSSSLMSSLISRQNNIDPDNMSYEELLRLGDEVGDVKKERWQEMAVQVLSSLPTHRWRRVHGDDTCIICQYNFVPNDRAMTLPCAHVFHEDCVGGWIRENNSCPLCKREINSK